MPRSARTTRPATPRPLTQRTAAGTVACVTTTLDPLNSIPALLIHMQNCCHGHVDSNVRLNVIRTTNRTQRHSQFPTMLPVGKDRGMRGIISTQCDQPQCEMPLPKTHFPVAKTRRYPKSDMVKHKAILKREKLATSTSKQEHRTPCEKQNQNPKQANREEIGSTS
ncbi:hypothetical protein BKA63DRAFT_81731 [Paraphoma chrysanthemicola]|nr:hypothetical protein BKA63DRAFT_81731 [Paraphoma chrysanthemicola]